MQRTVQPELLDTLPPDHPDALHNRRDLRWTNHLLGHYRWFERVLPRVVRRDETVLEVGAGTGDLGGRLADRGLRVAGLDLWPRPVRWPGGAAWHQRDLRSLDASIDYPIIIGNLIFHQFNDGELAAIGAGLRRHARVIMAAEPARRRVSQFLYRGIAPLFGANHVSLHDAHVSIAGGFRDHELPRALGLDPAQWHVRTSSTVLGTYRLIAERRA